MPDRALQLPFHQEEAAKVGRNVFRKQILPVGSLEYEGRTLNFTKDYLEGLAKSFNAGAFDQVAFQLANDRNEHTFDPEKFRGEVKGLEVTDDGLYGLIELTDEGAEVVSKNPKLGVSARIVEGIEKGGEKIGNAVQHVLGTLDPRVTGMKPWETVNLSTSDAGVVDLTSASFSDPVSGELSDEQRQEVKGIVGSALKDAGLDISDEDVERTIAQLIESATESESDEDKDKDKDRQPVAALSKADRDAIELAKSQAEEAKRETTEARADLAKERFEAKRDRLLEAGVPPAIVDLAEPVLKGDKPVIELSNGTKIDARDTVEKILENCEGMIDLSEIGVRDTVGDRTQELVDSWEEETPMGAATSKGSDD